MPGFLLLEDAQKQIGDRLGEFGQGLFGQFQPPAPPEPTEQSVTLQPDNDVVQRLTDVGMQTLNAPAEAGQRLADFGMNLIGQGIAQIQPEPPPTPAPAPIPAPGMPEDVTRPTPQPPAEPVERGGDLRAYARQAAQQAGIDPDIYERQIQQESGFRTNAVSPAGATGVAQFMPGTARGMGIDPTDPYASLDAGARLMRSNLDKYGGDYSKALAAYNAGPGNVDKYGGVPPFAETQTYIKNILGGAQKVAEPFVEGAKAAAGAVVGTVRDISQFGDKQLTSEEAYAACGPAAAVRFAQRMGRNPNLREALDMAKTVGWTAGQGMAGLGSEKALMDKMGVETQLIPGAQWDRFAREAQTGNPVTISTSAHYFYADGYNPDTGQFHVGRSGTDLRGGKEWMTRDEIVGAAQRLGGGEVQGALFANNPVAPSNSTTTGMTMGPMEPATTGFTAPGMPEDVTRPTPVPEERVQAIGEGMSAVREGQLTVLDDAIDRAGQGDTSLGRPFSDLGTAVSGMLEPARRAYTPSEETRQQAEELLQPRLGGVREQIANAPVIGGALGMARGPMLLSDRELLEMASPAELENARRGAQLTNPNPSDEEIAGVLRGLRTGEAYAGERAGAAGRAAGEAAGAVQRAGRGIDLDELASRRRTAQSAAPEQQAQEASALEKVMTVGVNNMLGGTSSMVSNAVSGVGENVYRPFATAVVRGEFGPAWTDLRAQSAAVGDALAGMAHTFRTGQRRAQLESTDYPEAFPGALGMLPFTSGNLRANAAMDEFNSILAIAGGQGAEAARIKQANPNLSTADIWAQFGNQLEDAGRKAQQSATFQSGGTGFGEQLAAARRTATDPTASVPDRAKGMLATLLVPFSKIPDAIVTRGVLTTPGFAEAALATRVTQAVRRGDPAAIKTAVRQWAMTEAVNSAIAYQVFQGNITGNGPEDKAKRDAMMNARDENGNPVWQPNSIRVPTPWGNRFIPYSSLGPISVRMGAIANFVEQYDQAEGKVDANLLTTTGKAIGETITDAWYLQNLGRTYEAMKNGKLFDAGGNVLLDFAERYVPDAALANQLRQHMDPVVREPRNPIEDVASRVPFASQLVPPRINPATGEPLERPRDIGSALVRSAAPGLPDPINEALGSHNLGVSEAPKTITQKKFTIDINDDEQRQYTIERGKAVAENVRKLIDDPRYDTWSYDDQRQALEKAVSDASADAAAIVWNSIPGSELDTRYEAYKAREAIREQPQWRGFRAP